MAAAFPPGRGEPCERRATAGGGKEHALAAIIALKIAPRKAPIGQNHVRKS
jgi:hypothetical protein